MKLVGIGQLRPVASWTTPLFNLFYDVKDDQLHRRQLGMPRPSHTGFETMTDVTDYNDYWLSFKIEIIYE